MVKTHGLITVAGKGGLVIGRLATVLCAALLGAVFPGCSGGGGGAGLSGAGGVFLASVHQGKLVDVYGLRALGGAKLIELYREDVLISVEIRDERSSCSNETDDQITYDFISPDPDTLQPHLLITREIGSTQFVAALDDLAPLVSPGQFGADTSNAPYPVGRRHSRPPLLVLRFLRSLPSGRQALDPMAHDSPKRVDLRATHGQEFSRVVGRGYRVGRERWQSLQHIDGGADVAGGVPLREVQQVVRAAVFT